MGDHLSVRFGSRPYSFLGYLSTRLACRTRKWGTMLDKVVQDLTLGEGRKTLVIFVATWPTCPQFTERMICHLDMDISGPEDDIQRTI